MKLYHPDSAQFRTNPFEILTPELRQERLNAIRGAYDALRGAKQARWGASHRGPSMGERAGAEGRRWTGKKNEWGGFAYEPEVRPHPDGLTEPFILSKNGVMMSLVAVVVLTVLSFRILYISPATIAARKHDEARSNLEEARRLGREHGEERRRELRKWIDEGGMKGFGTKIGHGGPRPPAEDHDKMTAKSHNGSSEAERSSASSQP
ncbi:uncharacterized protein EI90DRAFT_3125155 [Cantharellus anzutake]|uniref:uncharacterized protein n=1 Tax=Cantharellus anzutake TaxID=1750568 RepID=UPI001905B6F4|nr:uncharacterized protein EI90DRAFT_3125155 [Cantharellus anzutake]KAF8329367.1 hypothetical protein EI90DRAFT_3125155 [Cantharellus anzutake]